MKCPNVRVIYDRRKTSAKTGKAAVEVQVNFSRLSHKHITMGNATPATWQTVANSSAVKKKVAECQRIISAMQQLGEEVTLELFSKHYEAENAKEALRPKVMFNGFDQSQSFIDYVRDQVEGETVAKNTRAHKLCVIDSLIEFGKIKTLADVTPANLWDYDQWLRRTNDKEDYTIWHNYHMKVNKYTRQLKAAGMIPQDPYDSIGKLIPRGSNKERRPLSEKDLKKIVTAKLTGKLDKARDWFVFASFTGLSYCDIEAFDFNKHTELVGDTFFIDGSRIKTGCYFFTPILQPAMDVLKKNDYVLPHISNQKADEYLHLLEPLLGINKSITMHVGRHSFATLALSYHASIENLARMLGHRNIKTTQIYGKIHKKNVSDEVDRMKSAMKGNFIAPKKPKADRKG